MSTRRVWGAALLALTIATSAQATGARLAWDACLGSGGAVTKSFACDTNVGEDVLVGSFLPPAGVTAFNAVELKLELGTDMNGTLPNWWSLFAAGSCRPGGIAMRFNYGGLSVTCVDPWRDIAAGGIASYQFAYNGLPWRARLLAAVAIPPDSARVLDPATEYEVFRLALQHVATVGAGACDGCATPVCLVITSFKFYETSGPNLAGAEIAFTGPVSYVSWQSAVPLCPASIPVRRSTWGAVKAQYR